jgi:putative intracellular protease/amidase
MTSPITANVIIAPSSHRQLGVTGKKTGFWAEEFAGPSYELADARAEITLASLKGGQPPIDPASEEVEAQGAHSGTVQPPDRLLNHTSGNPLEKGVEKLAPNPDVLFAGAYSPCCHGGLGNAAEKRGVRLENSTVRALVSLIEEAQGGPPPSVGSACAAPRN